MGNIVKGCKGESSLAKERDGSDKRVDGQETVGGNSLEELRWEEARRKRRQGERRGNRGK